MPKLTEYLLKLATDHEEHRKYRAMLENPKMAAELFAYLTRQPHPGLTAKQAEAIQGHDSRRVIEVVLEELAKESSRPENPFYGIGVTFVADVNNHVQIHHLTE